MLLHYARLPRSPTVFTSLTGLRSAQVDALVTDVLPRYPTAERARLTRPTRTRAIGAGHPFELDPRNQILLSVIWLRVYPIHEVLAYLFGVSDTTVGRALAHVLPLLETSGRDTLRRPDPERKRRRRLDALVADTPELAVVLATCEQRVQRHQDRTTADEHDRGNKKQHTLKSHVAVDEETGQIMDVAERVPGPTADITLLAASNLLDRLPDGIGGIGDVAYGGIDKLHPQGMGTAPRRNPRGTDRPPEDVCSNRAFARRRIVVEQKIGRMRRSQALTQLDRHHRQQHTARTRAVAGLVNRQRAWVTA
jgi:hypothetical protein